MRVIQHISDVISEKTSIKKLRSPQWASVRSAHLKKNPTCAACGGDKKLEVHHIKPFHLYPELELDPTNLMTLCESWKKGVNCHLMFGHLGNYKSFNEKVSDDTQHWREKFNPNKDIV
jgi:hypothetical protein